MKANINMANKSRQQPYASVIPTLHPHHNLKDNEHFVCGGFMDKKSMKNLNLDLFLSISSDV